LLRLSAGIALVLALVPAPAQSAEGTDGTTSTGSVGRSLSEYPYRVYVPASYQPGSKVPLVVMVHGCQTSAEQQQNASLIDEVADREGFIVLYPDVNPIEANQPGPLRNCWQFPLPTTWNRGLSDPYAIATMTQRVMTEWSVDPDRVYIAGMSAGAFMTSIMAATYPELYAAVAINAGGAYADGTCLGVPSVVPVTLLAQLARLQMGGRARVIPRLAMGGDADQGIPPACVNKALDQGLRTNNLVLGSSQTSPISLTASSTREIAPAASGHYPSTVSTYLDPAGCLIGERWLIHGMNHFWPGGTTDSKYKSFTDPKGPNGAEVIWSFFERFTKSGPSKPCA
jgi:poly(hydroxyalkanoate) depolymerase family esterase